MFERFTERARQVVILAHDEARSRGHREIGTEHLVVGLAAEGEGIAARVLGAEGFSLDDLRAALEATRGSADPPPTGQMPFTPGARDALAQSAKEADALGHPLIGTEHVLLALTRPGSAYDLLGVEPAATRAAVLRAFGGG